MPLMVPKLSDVNFTPTSPGVGSLESTDPGFVLVPQIEHGHVTSIETPAPGVCRLALSSTARALIVVDGLPCANHEYDQLVVPVAGCHVAPPSVETSTPATTPPLSEAVPEIVSSVPSATLE